VAASAGLEIVAADVPVARVLAALVADADRRRTIRGYTTQPARVRLSDLRTRLLRDRVFEDPGRLLGRLKRRGLLAEVSGGGGEKAYEIPYPDELRQLLLDEVARSETVEPGPVSPVPDEPAEIRSMDGEFLDQLREARLKASLQTQGIIGKPTVPMLVIAGVKDTQVPIADIDLLLHSGDLPKDAWINPSGGHMGRQAQGWTDPVIFKWVTTPWILRELKVRAQETHDD